MSPSHKALVTGASRGIGRAVALELGRRDVEVYGTATSQEGADAITQAFKEEGVSGGGCVLRVESSESIRDLFSTLPATPDILVNNAGVTRDGLLIKMSEDDWNDVIRTNLSALFRICKIAVRPMMKARWGRVINVTSISGLMGNAGQCNYAAAKAGVIGFSKSLARELASRNVTVNCVAPGFIDTDMTRTIPDAARATLIQTIPMRRFGKPEEIAPVVALLASEAGGYITGETICVSGGLS